MTVTNLSQLQLEKSAKAVTVGLELANDFSQPYTSTTPQALTKSGITLAESFASLLGGTEINLDSARPIAEAVVKDLGDTSVSGVGSISTSTIDSAFKLASQGLRLFNSADVATATVANASFSSGVSSILGANSLSSSFFGLGGSAGLTVDDITDPTTIPSSWIFVTAPRDIGWDKQGGVSTVDNFGTNSPYVIYSHTSMRKLSMGDVLIEGFSAGKEVEDHVIKLESMMNMVMNSQAGYVSPYVWDLRAGEKSYGKFVIESLNVKEVMRNKKGRADRATASITLQQVPDFQVNDGRDLATQADLASGKSIVSQNSNNAGSASNGGIKATQANSKGGTNADAGTPPITGVDPQTVL
jgi:hypothetical protein